MIPNCLNCKKPIEANDLEVAGSGSEWVLFFCSESCQDEFVYPKLTNRICSREVCNNRVSEANRMLCPSCYQRGNHLGETEVSFNDKERAHWEWMEYALLKRIEEQVKVYSSQNMTQEELRSLVPSLQEEAA